MGKILQLFKKRSSLAHQISCLQSLGGRGASAIRAQRLCVDQ